MKSVVKIFDFEVPVEGSKRDTAAVRNARQRWGKRSDLKVESLNIRLPRKNV